MAITAEEKICIDCKKPFKPTSNVQKRCLDCGKIHAREYGKTYRRPSSEGRPKATTPPKLTKIETVGGDDSVVLRMLVAAGLVTEEKIQAAREIVGKLKA